MLNFEDVKKENKKEHNTYGPQILDHPYKILIFGGCGSGKTNALLNLINHKPYSDEMYLYAKDSFEAKYQFQINESEAVDLKEFNNSKAFIKYLDDMDNTCENMEEYNPDKNHKVLIVFDDMITDMLINKKLIQY